MSESLSLPPLVPGSKVRIVRAWRDASGKPRRKTTHRKVDKFGRLRGGLSFPFPGSMTVKMFLDVVAG